MIGKIIDTTVMASPADSGGMWYLEGFAPRTRRFFRVPVTRFPFRIGRGADHELVLLDPMVSFDHAEISRGERGLEVRDLGSSNGTSVNGERLEAPRSLAAGDLLRFASIEFRLGLETQQQGRFGHSTTLPLGEELESSLLEESRHFEDLLAHRRVTILLQAVVELPSRRPIGYEVLGRGGSMALPTDPRPLFDIAEALDLAPPLSRLFLAAAADLVPRLPDGTLLFVNSHPEELGAPDQLVDSVRRLVEARPDLRPVVEIHEEALADPPRLSALRRRLREIGVRIAYDDFGAGQSRLSELFDSPPDFLKFDRSLVAGIARAASPKQQLVAAMLAVVRQLGAVPIAEGIENEADERAVVDLGFAAAQGFLYGRPSPPQIPDPRP
jgi:EAL domain-containing protein (putative c-di-GMP-specific phosphodiesterase class I)